MQDNKNLLRQYAGMAAQLFAGLGLSAILGLWMDRHLIQSIPLLVWLLPLLFIIGMIVKVIRDTSK